GTYAADVNGDGKADLVAVNDAGLFVRTSTGTALTTLPSNWTGSGFYGSRNLPACVDGVKNGDETDVDCGGSCVPCPLGKVRVKATDCGDGSCQSGVCTAAGACDTILSCGQVNCHDTTRNGLETDVDCGGIGTADAFRSLTVSGCTPCGLGKICLRDLD